MNLQKNTQIKNVSERARQRRDANNYRRQKASDTILYVFF